MGALRKMLLPLSWIYGAAVYARNCCYDSGVFPAASVGTPVISVGNIVAGGTGKTPLVEAIVRMLLGAGARPAVLSRGYRRTSSGTVTVSDGVTLLADADAAGDEPAQIAGKFPGCIVVVDADRARGARFIESRFRPDAIILDDGFQHRALRRDLDLVVIDGGREPLLPAGNGRETERSLRRADMVVLRGDGADPSPEAFGKPAVRMRYRIERLSVPAEGATVSPGDLTSGGFVAFCGIGNPGSFRATLSAHGLAPAAFLAFPDHRRYDAGDLERITGAQRAAGAAYVVTTEKDAVRLGGAAMPRAPFGRSLVVATICAVITEGREELETAVLRALRRKAA